RPSATAVTAMPIDVMANAATSCCCVSVMPATSVVVSPTMNVMTTTNAFGNHQRVGGGDGGKVTSIWARSHTISTTRGLSRAPSVTAIVPLGPVKVTRYTGATSHGVSRLRITVADVTAPA